VQALRLCSKAGLVQLGSLALDGTKLRANASRRKAMSYERMAKKESQLQAEIAGLHARARALLAEAEATDPAEDELYGADMRGDELPAELARRDTRLARLREAKAELEAEAQQCEQARREAMRAEGRQPRDPPSGRDAFAPKATAQRNFTDPDSKIMKAPDGAFHQSYNAQAIVDSRTGDRQRRAVSRVAAGPGRSSRQESTPFRRFHQTGGFTAEADGALTGFGTDSLCTPCCAGGAARARRSPRRWTSAAWP